MSNTANRLDNTHARRLWLYLQDMLTPPERSDVSHSPIDTVRTLGMVQLDSINAIVRAHHHILWSRNTAYRESDYNTMLGHSPTVFEHFSHDAAILPLETYPFWQRQHQRRAHAFKQGAWGKQLASGKIQQQILAEIDRQGPMCSRDFANIYTQKADKTVHPWMRPPHKLALDYLWLKGKLCVSHRDGFIKYYELSERAIPTGLQRRRVPDAEQIDHLCHSALARLGFASAAEIQRFYGACELSEVKHWLARSSHDIRKVSVESHDGKLIEMHALGSIITLRKTLPEPCQRLRIVSPFDPVVRDRTRLKMLFGMDYRIEIFTPAAKRKYGYYVYPILEGDQITARIDVRADRQRDLLDVRAWWMEDGVKPGKGRTERLRSELKRLARLANLSTVSKVPSPSSHP